MSRRVNFKYFLNEVETDRELIDWSSTSSKVKFEGDRVEVTQSILDEAGHWDFAKIYPKTVDIDSMQGAVKDFDRIATLGTPIKKTCKNGPLCRCNDNCDRDWSILKNNFPGSTFQKVDHPLKKEEGVKYSDDKLPIDRMLTVQFPKALNAICKATLFGHKKYLEFDKDFLNFKKVKGGSQTYADALQRHNFNKNEIAEDSGLPHIFHKAWNALAELEIWIEENKIE